MNIMKAIEHRAFKDRVYEQFARIGAALSSPRRLELIDLLAQAERTVEELAELTQLTVANTSRHLQVLKSAQLVETRRDGVYVHYRLADGQVYRAWQAVRELGDRRLAELDRIVATFAAERAQADAVTAEELLVRLQRGDVVVLDVRPREEFESGHIPGAISMPVAKLRRALKAVPADREVIAYCRGPYCVYSDEAVKLLRRRGVRARRLAIGLPDWAAAGHPVALSRASADA